VAACMQRGSALSSFVQRCHLLSTGSNDTACLMGKAKLFFREGNFGINWYLVKKIKMKTSSSTRLHTSLVAIVYCTIMKKDSRPQRQITLYKSKEARFKDLDSREMVRLKILSQKWKLGHAVGNPQSL
nr:hypothetical protein [Tanacetum cinerariifolium]